MGKGATKHFPKNFCRRERSGSGSSCLRLMILAGVCVVLGAPTGVRAAVITVSTLADPAGVAGTCSLRQAITNANNDDQSGSTNCTAGNGDDTIMFAVTGTIGLASSLPGIAGNMTIKGPAGGIAISGNNAVQVMTVESGGTVTLDHLTISGGRSARYGAIYNAGTLTITDSRLSGNDAGDSGGAIYNDGGTLKVSNSSLSDNLSLTFGGAVDNVGGALTVTGSTLAGNSTGDSGGAIANRFGVVTLINSTLSGNSAGDLGGAIDNVGGTAAVTNSTLADNSAGNSGGALYNSGFVKVRGSILANSMGGNCDGSIGNEGNNLSDDDTCGFGIGTAANGESIGDNVNPRLDPAGLKNNGGPTPTIALEPGSPAIDAIALADCTDQATPAPKKLSVDQRGFGRPDPGDVTSPACDIGAYEYGAVAPSTPVCEEARASVPFIFPPNRKLVAERIAGVTDAGGSFSIRITAIHQDEPVGEYFCPDGSGIGTAEAQLRAQRDGDGDGRVYHLEFTATDDDSGNQCGGEVTVCVPHDRGQGTSCGDGGALFDSTRCN